MRSLVLIPATAFLLLSCTDAALRTPTAPSETVTTEGALPGAQRDGHPMRRRSVRAPTSSAPVLGSWGGQHIQLELLNGGGRVELDCAHGTIDEPIRVGDAGTFEVRGTLTLEHGGPVTNTDVENIRPARYRGSISESTMSLTITVDGAPETFTLVRNRLPHIVKCL